MSNRWKTFFASILIPATVNVSAQPAVPPAEAKALVAAMQVAEQAREGVLAGVQKAVQQGRASQKEFDCIKAANLGSVEDAYASAFAAALSPAEMKDATAFLSSPEGKAYLRYARSEERKQRGLPDPDPKSGLTDKETAAALGFVEKSAGKKLLETRSFETAEFRSALIRGISEVATKCKS
jgi:hypothetical protein